MLRTAAARFLPVALAVPALFGCDKLRTTRECRELANIVETSRAELDQATRPKTPAAYRAAEPLYRKIAARIRLTVGSAELRTITEEYAASVEAIGPNVRAYADALESGDAGRVEQVRGDVERATRREQQASRRLEDECHDRY